MAEAKLSDSVTTRTSDRTRKIPLTRGNIALVSERDFDRVKRHKWHTTGNGRYAGRQIPCPRDEGPRQTLQLMHRFILNAPDDMEVDHINGDGFDNRWSNLRICSRGENAKNLISRTGVVPFKGVYPRGSGFTASIVSDGKKHWLGSFPTAEDAAWAYDMKARELHGEFAATNFTEAHPPDIEKWRDRIRRFRESAYDRGAQLRRASGPRGAVPYKGVSKSGAGYVAKITVNGSSEYLGYFQDPETAAREYDKHAARIYGTEVYLNFPDEVSS